VFWNKCSSNGRFKFCNNGLEALQELEKSKPYDVIICDYDAPI
jgi:CheY-like chemotaxis protein